MSEPRTFEHAFVVGESDIDALGHASNVAFVRWIQEVALAHSAAVGLALETYRRLGAVFVVARHEIDYLRPALRGEALVARTFLASLMAAKSVRATEISRPADGAILARARTTWGYVDLASGAPMRIHPEVRVAFEPYLDPSAPGPR